jgi:hypothetical protein
MSVTRGFLVIAPLYLIIGLGFGFHMAATGNQALSPIHTHLSLLGFTLMMVFGLFYRLFPLAAATLLARAHFWLHQAGTLVLFVMQFLLVSGQVGEGAMVPLVPAAIVAVLAGAVCFAITAYRCAR